MSQRTRVAVWVVRGAFVCALALELLALHFPAPSGVDEPRREDVDGAWSMAGRVARLAGRLVPDALDPILDPLLDDKTAHFLLFLPLGALAAAERRLRGPLTPRGAALLVVGLIAYAILGEASQALFGRYPEVLDCVANALGAVTGITAVAMLTRPPRIAQRATRSA